MANRFQAFTKHFVTHPKQIFMIDGLGAMLTACLLGVVLVRFSDNVGLSRAVLYVLSAVAVVLAIYSFSCYFLVGKRWRNFLRVIAGANLTYCCITITLMMYFRAELTPLGLLYFVGEIAIVASLAFFELGIAAEEERSGVPPMT